MLSVEVCSLPATGGSTFIVVAGLFLLIAGVIVARWVRASAGRMSAVVAPLVLLGGLALAPSVTDPCAIAPSTTSAPTTTTAPTTTVAPIKTNLVLEIDTAMLAPMGIDSVAAEDDGIVFELGLFGDVQVHIDWGDGKSDDVVVAGPFPHTYAASGKYTITVSGSLTGLGQNASDYDNPVRGAEYLTAVRSFGDLGITSLSFAFDNAINLLEVPATLPSTVTNLFGLFAGASSFNGDVSGWDTNNVKNMSSMFSGASAFNGDVSAWDTGNVTDMRSMFESASSFNCDLGDWDTSNVTDMGNMFFVARAFNGDVSGWDTGVVTDMSWMFAYASAFDSDISGWNTSNVTNMSWMFGLASVFNQNLNSWNTSKVTNMSSMFHRASAFNQNLNSWDTSNVTDMNNMFGMSTSFNGVVSGWDTGNVTDMSGMFSSSPFNQSLSSWDTSNVVNMASMFSNASVFNGDISSWDTSNVTTMAAMFSAATAFNQSLGGWDISAVTSMVYMLERSGLSVLNYDATLNGWGDVAQTRQPNVTLGAVTLRFSSNSLQAREALVDENGSNWTVIDSGCGDCV